MDFKTSEFRPAIIRLHENGKSMNKIAKDLGISRCAVQNAVKRFEETGSNEDRPGRGRKKSARSKKNIQRARRMIKQNPTTKANSTRKLAKKLGVDQRQAWEILREDLGLKPWKYQKRQKLNAQAKQKRLDRCQAMLTRFSRRRHRQIIFSDEKLFDIQQVGLICLLNLILFSVTQSPKRQDLDRRSAGYGRKSH